MSKRRIGHAGTSIVEVLVAMVILLIGIFGIIRIFPNGFSMIQYGEKVSRAEKMANAVLEQARSNAENLPDAIAPVLFNPATFQPLPALDPTLTPGIESNDLQDPRGMPADLNQARFFGFNRTRRVIGEMTKIPSPTAGVPYMPDDPQFPGRRQLVSLYTLKFGPMDAQYFRPVVYSGRPMERVVFTQDATRLDADDLGLFRYGVMYGRDRLVLYFAPVTYARVFKVQFSYVISDPQGPFRAQSLPDTAIAVAADAFRVEVPMPANGTPEQAEEQVSRAFNEIPLAAPFSTLDPYEFKLLNSFVGILGFNPLGAALRSDGSTRELTAKIDYDVADWHIVTEDVQVPQEPPFRVKLTLNFLKKAGDVQDNQETYQGLMPALGLQGIDVVVVDPELGLTMDSRTLNTEDPNAATRALNGAVLYQTGAIDFKPGVRWTLPDGTLRQTAESIAGKQLRVYYRTEDEFGLQVQKAYTNYLRSQNPLTITPGQYGQFPNGYLVFPASDNNQTVLIDYSFTQQLPGGGPTRRMRVSGELQPVRDPLPDVNQDTPQRIFAALTTAPASSFWFVRVNNADRSAIDPAPETTRPQVVPGSIVIHSVRGVSVRSRVVWREGNRWRRLENSTYLARQGTLNTHSGS